jgi:cholesterol oxidase
VLLRKDERWFVKEDLQRGGYEYWPLTRADLDPHYDRVEMMLRPQRYPFDRPPYSDTSKTKAFGEAARRIGLQPFLPKLAITFANEGEPPVPGEPIREENGNLHGRTRQTCRLVGECVVGCNYGSKNTLDYTYLSAAKRLGAELRTDCEVVTLEPRGGVGGGYSVRYREHPISPEAEGSGGPRTLTADRLILSAGALGSTHLLLRNRSAFPRISKLLGTRFCSNGDYLTFAVKASEEAGRSECRASSTLATGPSSRAPPEATTSSTAGRAVASTSRTPASPSTWPGCCRCSASRVRSGASSSGVSCGTGLGRARTPT